MVIRSRTFVVDREPATSAAEAGHDLVADHQDRSVADAHALQVAVRRHQDAVPVIG
jgi:hypothetical protein